MFSAIRTLAVMRSLDPHQRLVYVTLRLRRATGIRRDSLPSSGQVIRKILFVCHGNIMRSPMAEAWLRKIASQPDSRITVQTFSAGTFAALGRPGDARAREVSSAMGVSLDSHSARQLSPEDVADADLICVMDWLNETVCVARYPHAARKIVLLGAFGREPGEPLEILDPIQGNADTVRACYQRVARAVQALWQDLVSRAQPSKLTQP